MHSFTTLERLEQYWMGPLSYIVLYPAKAAAALQPLLKAAKEPRLAFFCSGATQRFRFCFVVALVSPVGVHARTYRAGEHLQDVVGAFAFSACGQRRHLFGAARHVARISTPRHRCGAQHWALRARPARVGQHTEYAEVRERTLFARNPILTSCPVSASEAVQRTWNIVNQVKPEHSGFQVDHTLTIVPP